MPTTQHRGSRGTLALGAALALGLAACNGSDGDAATSVAPPGGSPPNNAVGEQPRVTEHLSQADLASGAVGTGDAIDHGARLFRASFNTLDGAGRPGTTGTGQPRPPETVPSNFNRISGPEANACADCHAFPFVGGSGGNSSNVFVMAERLPDVNFDAGAGDDFQQHELETVGLERSTPGLMGTGLIELLAREMTAELLAIESDAIATATNVTLAPESRDLTVKGVNFGELTAFPDGSVDRSKVRGVDDDLVIKPFHAKGTVVSLREFSNNALNQHHGMQSSERFGQDLDPDGDGHANELTEGDLTAISLFQATLPPPGRILPTDGGSGISPDVLAGEGLFAAIGCVECHVPALRLQSSVFTEPGPYNPPGNLKDEPGVDVVSVDLLSDGPGPFLRAEADGTILVPAYTDLKRHDMGPLLDNEAFEQGGVPTSVFLTRRLWGMASEPPYLHHGRATTIRDAILLHGGEGQAARDAFEALNELEQDQVLEFLTTLRTREPGANTLVAKVPGPGFVGERPATATHVSQADLDAGTISPEELRILGGLLFDAPHNRLDGAGRPETAGDGSPRVRREGTQAFNRISGPDSNACLNCHNVPRGSGGGGIVHNVHTGAEAYPFVNFDGEEGDDFQDLDLRTVGNERATIAVLGSGFIELLAREMSFDLIAHRDDAVAQAQSLGVPVQVSLDTKGVNFGALTANPDGSVFYGDLEGVDKDLVVKPFRQKGTVVSLRDFSNFALNRHNGMQSVERFGAGVDADNDGHVDELTVGDVSAITIYQSLLPVPGRRLPSDPLRLEAVELGETVFSDIGCADCHVPELVLDDPVFTEPGPFNPPGNLRPSDVPQPYAYDLTQNGRLPRLDREPDGTVIVPAFTDLKRHDMGPDLAEEHPEAGVPRELFLTKKLWGMANEPPYMHHGRALTITEAILMHGGDAQAARDAFEALPDREKDSLIDFLNTLQVLPFGSDLVIFD